MVEEVTNQMDPQTRETLQNLMSVMFNTAVGYVSELLKPGWIRRLRHWNLEGQMITREVVDYVINDDGGYCSSVDSESDYKLRTKDILDDEMAVEVILENL